MSVRTGDILEPIHAELVEFERRLEDTVAQDLGPMGEAMGHIVRAGGKRLRPALVLLSGALGDADPDHLYTLAMAIEFIHTATLVHDDLIDEAPTRRGLATIHAMLGANPAIIVGDYYFAKGANLMSSIGMPEIDEVLSRTVMTICMGELLQMTTKTQYRQPLDTYYGKIERKTAALLSACTYCGALVAGALDDVQRERLRRYGHALGMAFQIADDLLDYVATAGQLGKPVGADLRQGTVTLPLMLALEDERVAPQLDAILREPLHDGDYEAVVQLVRQSNAVTRTEQYAHEWAERARAELSGFAEGRERRLLEALCDYVVERRA